MARGRNARARRAPRTRHGVLTPLVRLLPADKDERLYRRASVDCSASQDNPAIIGARTRRGSCRQVRARAPERAYERSCLVCAQSVSLGGEPWIEEIAVNDTMSLSLRADEL